MRRGTVTLALLLMLAYAAAAPSAETGINDLRISTVGTDGVTSSGAYTAAVAYNSTNNEFLVVWLQTHANDTEIYGQRIDAATGAEIGGDFRISDMGPDGDANYAASQPAVAYNGTNNEYLVLWSGDDNTPPLVNDEMEIFGQRVNAATGAEIGADFRISNMGIDGNPSSGSASYPRAAWNGLTNEFLVIWIGADGTGETEIRGQRLNGAGLAEIGGQATFSDIGPPGDLNRGPVNHPDIAFNFTNNEYLLVWAADDLPTDNENEVFAQRVSGSNVAEVGANDFRVSDMGPDTDMNYPGYNVSVAYNATANEYLVVWNGTDNVPPLVQFEYEIFGQRINAATGAEVGTNDFRISDAGIDGQTVREALDPDVSYAPSVNEYLVTWRADDTPVNDEREIFVQRISSFGLEIGPDVRVSDMGPAGDTNFMADSQQAAHSASGRALIAWSGDDVTDDEREIYGQFYNASAPGDFDADSKADLLWRNSATGNNSIWLVTATTVGATASLPAVSDTNFQVAGIGDFQGDGKADVLWRNSATGANVQWLMNGTTVAVSTVLTTVADANWRVAGIGDFQGDGKADILWRNFATGDNSVWLMDGTTIAVSAALPMVADTNWVVAGIADFQGDGRDDVFWRHAAAGTNVIWLMNGAVAAATGATTAVPDLGWTIAGFGDLQGDGKADVLWRHATTGDNAVWFMNGMTLAASGTMTTVADTNWKIVRIADFQGDAKADILWRHNVSGNNSQWLMNGATAALATPFPPVADVNWQIAGRP